MLLTQRKLPEADPARLRRLVRHRMCKPQRHRLLHGFPLAAAMPYADQDVRAQAERGDAAWWPRRRADRELLVGVLPHSFCNPKIAACGFCTFPHEKFGSIKAAAVVAAVAGEIERRVEREPDIAGRAVKGLYFGGGTANLAPAEPFRRLCRKLREVFDLRDAEVTLEGVPAYFVKRRSPLMDILREELGARHYRISMGIQTFSLARLEQMGRLAFGTPSTFQQVVRAAQSRGFTTSADLLFNLPGQSRDEMREDVTRALDLGLDQVCLYHLVMFRGLGAPWARDEQLLASLPDNETAAANWLSLREFLLRQGFYQSTLTNFEANALRNDPRSYRYERMSFQPDRFDVLGFGPSGISYTASEDGAYGLKTMNSESSAEYLQAVAGSAPVWNRYYAFDSDRLRLLQATRNLAALNIDRRRYGQAFGGDPVDDFRDELEALRREDLLRWDEHGIEPTPLGMFYADTIAAVLAHPLLRKRRGSSAGVDGPAMDARGNDNGGGFM